MADVRKIRDLVTVGSRRAIDSIVDGLRLWEVRVTGIEVTQAIQYFQAAKHLTDLADRGPDNSVQLIAHKAAYVRVYLGAGLFSSVDGVTGSLRVRRRKQFGKYDPVDVYSPAGVGSATADEDPDYLTQRADINSTLNFVIPAGEFYGTLELTAQISGHGDAQKSVILTVDLVQTLRVRGIMIHYAGPSTSTSPAAGSPPVAQLDLAAPTLADLQETAGTALAAMPVQATGSFASAGTMNWFVALDDPRGTTGCTSNWDSLLAWLQLMRDNDGNRSDVVYYGLLPAAMPTGNVVGCGDDGLGAAAALNESTFVHEIGHGYGFEHTQCGNVGKDVDTNYPTYEPYPSISIGEFAIDIRTGQILDPRQVHDYMSYCRPRWMSLYHHDLLIEHPRLEPRWLPDPAFYIDPVAHPFDLEWLWWPDPPWLQDSWETRLNDVISIVGEVKIDGSVSVLSVARVRVEGLPQGRPTDFIAELFDEQLGTLAQATLIRADTQGGCCCGGGDADSDPSRPPFRFKAYVNDAGPGSALRIRKQDEIIWERRPAGEPPQFDDVAVGVTGNARLELHWRVESSGQDAEIRAQWSKDDGRSWHGLAIGLLDGAATLPLTGLPAGPILIRLQAHDGFFSTSSNPVEVEIPALPPIAVILHPKDGQTIGGVGPLQILGNGVDNEGQPVDDQSVGWVLDGRPAGSGREIWIPLPRPGRHELTLRLRHRDAEASKTITFEVPESN